jgi:hypothetical protein
MTPALKHALAYQYPLLVGAVPSTGAAQTVIKTASFTIPPNSKFVWVHTLNGTIQSAAGTMSLRVQLYDSVHGALCNVPTDIENIAGAIYKTFLAAPRSIRPFPLPETYIFNAGATVTATYTVILAPNGGNPSFASVGLILCGYRIPI